MKHEELKQGDIVIFKIRLFPDLQEEEDFHDGNVIAVYPEMKKVCICYLEGYKSRSDEFPYEKVVAKYDENGERMKFGCLSGPSVLLEQ